MADADKIELEIVTPKGRALAATVDEVTAPSVAGRVRRAAGAPARSSRRCAPGIVTYRQGDRAKKVAVGRGFAEAGQNKLLILAEEFAERQQIDPVLVARSSPRSSAKLEKVLARPR